MMYPVLLISKYPVFSHLKQGKPKEDSKNMYPVEADAIRKVEGDLGGCEYISNSHVCQCQN